MQNVVIDKPYVFVPPYQGRIWPRVLLHAVRPWLWRAFGIDRLECHGMEHLEQSVRAGHGILLAPNHCRPADPFVVGEMTRRAGLLPYTLASWHLFMQGRLQSWLLRRGGVFSIYREGMDRAAVNAAVDILTAAKRPLVLFPEGVINRANDRLNPLMEGTSFIARTAAKRRAAATPPGQVVVHPVALRYTFRGDVRQALVPALEELEHRLSWRPQGNLPLLERITKLGVALLGLKEIEFFGESQTGEIFRRVDKLIDRLLGPLETEWTQGRGEGSVVARVKRLRAAILPDMVAGDITEAERARRWRQLADVYLAQQLSCYPPDYITSDPHPDRLLETVERFEEDLKDQARIYRPMTAAVHIGTAIAVGPTRDRSAAEDPLLAALESQLRDLLDKSR